MAAADVLIERDGPVAVPLDYVVPSAGEIQPLALSATFADPSSHGPYVPALEIVTPDGRVLGPYVLDSTIAAGASATVSWFPGAIVTPDDTTIQANNQTGTSYTLALTDAGLVVELNNAAAITLTVPTNASVPFPIGTVLELWQQGAGQVTVSPAGGVTLRSPGAKTKLALQYASATLRKRATDEWLLEGDIST